MEDQTHSLTTTESPEPPGSVRSKKFKYADLYLAVLSIETESDHQYRARTLHCALKEDEILDSYQHF